MTPLVWAWECLISEDFPPRNEEKTSISEVQPGIMIIQAMSRPRDAHNHAQFRERQSMILPEVRRRADATTAIEKFHFRERQCQDGRLLE